jgi:hypothetical protein
VRRSCQSADLGGNGGGCGCGCGRVGGPPTHAEDGGEDALWRSTGGYGGGCMWVGPAGKEGR